MKDDIKLNNVNKLLFV